MKNRSPSYANASAYGNASADRSAGRQELGVRRFTPTISGQAPDPDYIGTGFSLLIIIALFTFSSCAAQRNGGKSYYHEDLYPLRPKFTEPVDTFRAHEPRNKGEVVPTRTVNTKVDGVLDSINTFTMARRFIDGYTIQIYSGQNRDEAMGTKRKMATEISDLNSSATLEYNQPKFRVRVGSYYSRLEAQKDLVRLKRWFPNAILVPEKIPVR